jgi:hypothetical protein
VIDDPHINRWVGQTSLDERLDHVLGHAIGIDVKDSQRFHIKAQRCLASLLVQDLR